MMFAPRPGDFDRLRDALQSRFGAKVRLTRLLMVDRDVNGLVGVVESKVGLGRTIYSSDKESHPSRFRFERRGSQILCFAATEDWEVSCVEERYNRLATRIAPLSR